MARNDARAGSFSGWGYPLREFPYDSGASTDGCGLGNEGILPGGGLNAITRVAPESPVGNRESGELGFQ